ncbi:pilus assembly protein PilP [Inhella sp. 1Y17]|uniref:Pilus assembly protein PilP n=2 Tax=Inhella proteolytica TaxID=2795029 RepID=A0A931J4J0_9BURK|nr:pilus assembly protein PilP [Inhella proteolytica]
MTVVRFACALMLLQMVAGCSSDLDQLQTWTEAERRNAKPSVQALVPPKKFLPQPYDALDGVEPFSTQKLSVASKQEAAQPNSMLAAEMNRRREPLEAYPIDSMSMVGSMARAGVPHAILKVDNLLYYVKAGDYLGQNFGKILKINETEVVLREIVQDPSGEWVERTSTLTLQEAAR